LKPALAGEVADQKEINAMRPMSTIRRWHFDQLRYALKTVQFVLQTTARDDLTTCRDGPDGWTVAEVVGHLLDCERLFLERATLTMTQDNPELPFPDQAEDVRRGGYREGDPQAILAEWEHARDAYLTYLAAVPEDGWNREGRHPRYAPFSLNDQLFLACWHDQVHIEQMTRILTTGRNQLYMNT
jgi:uncharacterized damage-inducible protein DinB